MKAREYLILQERLQTGLRDDEYIEDDSDFLDYLWRQCPEFEIGDFVVSEDRTYFGIVKRIGIRDETLNKVQFYWNIEWHKWQEDLEPPFTSPEYPSRPPAPISREDCKRKFPTSLVWKAE
jgi:hypothetical protein